jgi:signal transduction histidine kinase/CheY-like chemotaxis protein/HPt (histidine-containing phosphotransfer) domain-containing protein
MGIEPEWEPGSACSAETLAARRPLREDERWLMVNTITRRYLPTMLICAGIAYHGLSIGHWSTGADQNDLKLMTIYGLTGVAMLAFGWRAHHQPPPLMWSVHIGCTAFLVVTATVTIGYVLGGDPSALYLYLLLQLVAGAVIHDRRWLFVIMGLGYLSWAIASLWVPDVNWVRGIAYFVGFSAVSGGISFVRGRALAEMEELRLAAERVSQAKTELLANASHEVRTPMNGVLGLSAVLLDTDLDPKQHKMVVAIRESADALVGIVDEILDFSQLQRGQVELQEAPFDMRVLVDSVVDLMKPRAEAKGLRLGAEMQGIGSQRYMGDAGRIRQVLLNLVSNAIKFTDAGSVSIHAEVLEQAEMTRVRLSVSDTGPGISADAIEGIFTRYQRNESDSNRSSSGTGLGLAISRQLLELMGGTLGVTSAMDEGTRFWAELELRLGPENTLRVVDSDGTGQVLIREGASVLVAEDDPTSRMVTEALLRKLSCKVDIATDGRDALAKANSKDYDLVFMDCHMPMIDGFQATKRLRKSFGEKELPVIALTASVGEEDRIRCLDAGMNDMVGKPVRTSMLAKALEKWVPLSSEPGSRSASTVPPPRTLSTRPPPKSVSTLPPPPALDLEMVRRLVSLDGEDDDFIEDVLLGYVDQLRESLKKMSDALDEGDMETTRLAAHTVKGASKQIGATRVGELLGGIESATTIDAARNLLEIVEEETPRVAEAVKGLLQHSKRAS